MWTTQSNSTPALRHELFERSGRTGDQVTGLAALVLLGGSVTRGRLATAVGRSVLDLPLAAGRTVLSEWHREAVGLARSLGRGPLPLRVLLDRSAPAPFLGARDPLVSHEIERDPFELRGTAGVLRDLAVDYADDDYLLVANAAQALFEPLTELWKALAATRTDASIVSHADGTPSGMMLLRCGCLREVREVGFVDMKEQALPAIARDHRVGVVSLDRPSGLPIRTLADYIGALARRCRSLDGHSTLDDPFAEDWRPLFSLREEGSEVDSSARLHDSVVLRGGRVGRNAVVVRSVVGPGGSVRRRSVIVDGLIGPR